MANLRKLFAVRYSILPHLHKLVSPKINSFNPIRPGSHQIKAKQFKMTTILDWFNALIPYCATFSFQVMHKFWQNWAEPCFAWVAAPYLYHHHYHHHHQNPRHWFCDYNRLNSYLLVHEFHYILTNICISIFRLSVLYLSMVS